MESTPAEILREYGPFEGAGDVHGVTFDGRYVWFASGDHLNAVDPDTGDIPAPGGGGDSGMAWAEGALWVGQYLDRRIHQVEPETGRILRTITSERYVTGVTWVEGELWHATQEDGASEVRRIDDRTGEVLQSLEMPQGRLVSGLESDGAVRLFCGGGADGRISVIARPGGAGSGDVRTGRNRS
ncbi:MAG TPA: glutamine cyclotransferase [Brevundimonas sp.]